MFDFQTKLGIMFEVKTFSGGVCVLNLSEYQRQAFGTSKIDWANAEGRRVAILGVLGELGSIAAVMKKRIRDGTAYTGATIDLVEESGDALWYLAAIATHYGLDLESATRACTFGEPAVGANGHLWSLIEAIMRLNSILAADDEHFAVDAGNLEEALGEVTQMVLHALEREGLDLTLILEENLRKTKGLFGEVSGVAPHHDARFHDYEQLPRAGAIEFIERPRGTVPEVLLRMNGMTIGDRLTDNFADPDGYRFHDALHLGYVAVLGWSPVTRALLRLKRKSDSVVDEQQDGARAIIIEEAITLQVFNHARDNNLFLRIERLDYSILKWIQKMVRGLEVDTSTAAEWQRAILEGYKAFRQLKENRGGALTIDAVHRGLIYAPPASA
jgi:NTP pyrophosphatase (non-canonical NTP hydrolase)